MPEPAIAIDDLCFSLGGLPILKNVNMRVNTGDYLAMLGPNGGGKSTLLKLILGLYKPDSGTIRVLGQRSGEAGGRIGYLPQHTHVSKAFPITVLDAVRMGLVEPGLGGVAGFLRDSNEIERAQAALERVDMLSYANRSLSGLSGGQKQRVFIARALVSDPALLLLDEPTASVDSSSRASLFHLLKELNKEMTIIMVSHDISVLATGVKSVACVNHSLHFHAAPEITEDIFKKVYGSGDSCCPVELVTHGEVPHRVLEQHEKEGSDA